MIKNIDINHYMGRWYEITAYPQWFEDDMNDISALYTLKEGYVEIRNSGYKNGVYKEVRGRAKVVKNTGNKLFKVYFYWPFYGKYLIINIADDYSWVIVSNPKHSTLWILSRTKTMEKEQYDVLIKWLKDNDFDISKMKPPKINH